MTEQKTKPNKKKGNKKRNVERKPLTQGVDLRDWIRKNGMPKEETSQDWEVLSRKGIWDVWQENFQTNTQN